MEALKLAEYYKQGDDYNESCLQAFFLFESASWLSRFDSSSLGPQ